MKLSAWARMALAVSFAAAASAAHVAVCVGDEPPSGVRFVPIPAQTATVGEPLDYTLVAKNLAGVSGSIAYSVVSATAPPGTYSLDGARFTFTPAGDGDFSFTFRATNATAGASAKATMAVSAVLAAPEGLDNSGISATSFTANWDAVAGAASYLLVVAESDFEEDDEPDSEEWAESDILFSQTVSGTSFEVDGLIPGTYYWRVCAVGNDPGPFSETVEVTLVADPSAPPSIRSIGDIAVSVGQTASATIRVSAPKEAPVTSLEIMEGDPSAVLEDRLFSFTPEAVGTYSFTIAAVNANGVGTASFSVVATLAAPKKFAVCVGIDEYENISGLEGCVNDAKFMAANLVGRGGWDAADVVVLLDSAATKDAIRGAISNVAAQAMAGDTFVYQHSSHGGQFNDMVGEILYGDDGKATYLCVYDEDYYDNETAYNDYEIAADLAAFPAGVKVAVIVDACHSGGLFKSREVARTAAASFDLSGRVSAHMEAERARRRARGESVARSLAPAEIGWATAAEYYESSMDGGFYHSDGWLSDPAYGDEYYDSDARQYVYPSSYRKGGVFLGSATWGWWSGDADTDAEAGDKDGFCDVYEFWKKGYDFSSQIGDLWGNPDYTFHPQCTNVTVLRSVELGWSGPSAEPFPAIASGATPEEFAVQLAGSADTALVEHVRDAATYDAFRVWAGNAKDAAGAAPAGLAAVQESPWAWLGFAIGSDRLLDLDENDISISSFAPDPATGAFALEVGIDGAAVADGADPDRLAETFLLQGADALDDEDAMFTPQGLSVESVAPANGRVRFVAAPPADADSFFLRVRVK